jgi:hypothetical protein
MTVAARNCNSPKLVHCITYNHSAVAFKMGRRQGARRAGRNRRATQPPAHFQRNPLGRGQLAVFPRCSLGPYQFRYGRFARALKNSQLTYGGAMVIYDTVH